MNKPQIVIISPALANANNGNWQTARRWSHILRARYRVDCMREWVQSPVDAPQAMIALHARRSAAAIDAFSIKFPERPLVLVLTGTDLYRDIRSDVAAQRSLQQASHLVVLQPAGLDELAPALQAKTSVVRQSAPSLKPQPRNPEARYFDVIMIGHLREEKQPAVFMQAALLLRTASIRMVHVGAALDAALGAQAAVTQARCTRYRWLGPLSHAQTRQRLKHSALMVLASSMEGGANVIIEALTSGVPVLASDIPGNRGMLGEDYAGYFALGDSVALAQLIERACNDRAFYATLQSQCAASAVLYSPAAENAAVLQLMDNCMLNALNATNSPSSPTTEQETP